MQQYRTWIDPRAAETRKQLNRLEIRDLGSQTMRWALHLSEKEMAQLERLNPDTLGNFSDPKQYNAEWAKFINHPASKPYKVQRV
jgi:hypothetical protein